LNDLFGEHFTAYTAEMQKNPLPESRLKRFAQNSALLAATEELDFPNFSQQPYHVREVFEYFKAMVSKEDLQMLDDGKLFKENVINLYFKILEKMNLV